MQKSWKTKNNVEACYKQWKHSLNSILHECFPKKKLISDKQVYKKEIRQDIKDRKKLKKELSRHDISKSKYQCLTRKLKKVDKLIDSKTADHNSQAIRQKIGRHGTISKQDFWKVKRNLPLVVLKSHPLLLMQPGTI